MVLLAFNDQFVAGLPADNQDDDFLVNDIVQ